MPNSDPAITSSASHGTEAASIQVLFSDCLKSIDSSRLLSKSEYFRCLFKNHIQFSGGELEQITMNDVSASEFEFIMEVLPSLSDFSEIASENRILLFFHFVMICDKYLFDEALLNCSRLFCTAWRSVDASLWQQMCLQMASQHFHCMTRFEVLFKVILQQFCYDFMELTTMATFVELLFAQLNRFGLVLLSSDELNVENERFIFEFLLNLMKETRKTNKNEQNQHQKMVQMMKCVRYSLFNGDEMKEVVNQLMEIFKKEEILSFISENRWRYPRSLGLALCRNISSNILGISDFDHVRDPGCLLARLSFEPIVPVGFVTTLHDRFLYLCGGEYGIGKGRWNKTVWRYDCFSREWSEIGTMTEERRHFALFLWRKSLVMVGGFGKYRTKSQTVSLFDLESGQTSRVVNLPQLEFLSQRCCIVDDSLYLFDCGDYHLRQIDLNSMSMESPDGRNVSLNYDCQSVQFLCLISIKSQCVLLMALKNGSIKGILTESGTSVLELSLPLSEKSVSQQIEIIALIGNWIYASMDDDGDFRVIKLNVKTRDICIVIDQRPSLTAGDHVVLLPKLASSEYHSSRLQQLIDSC